ncbi:hypothetical protein [Nonomuraea dietziae]|uniref:hypothetical protein n=1 Tax=Nonomuraea dietziae TaxID=65515 RepID=UPI0031E0C8CD
MPYSHGRGVAVGGVVAGEPAEGRQERLGHDVVGQRVAQPAGHVSVERGSVPVEQHGEGGGISPGTVDHLRVVRFAMGDQA